MSNAHKPVLSVPAAITAASIWPTELSNQKRQEILSLNQELLIFKEVLTCLMQGMYKPCVPHKQETRNLVS